MQKELVKFKACLAALVALILLAGAGFAFWGKAFTDSQVRNQLVQEQIMFPEAGSPALDPQKYPDLQQYAGQTVDTGPKAKAFADEFIWVHLMDASGGKTYAQVSAEARENPDDEELIALKDTLFEGSMLRSSLLAAYAFSMLGLVAGMAAIALLAASALSGILAARYLLQARR